MIAFETEQLGLAIRSDLHLLPESREGRAVRKIEKSIAYMVRHVGEPLQASTLAAEVNISPSHFYTLFKRYVGSSPMDYFIRLRLRCACHLLENTEMSVKAIAYTLGYDDPFYFSRIFKSFNQLAPSHYRLLKLGTRETKRDWNSSQLSLAPRLPEADLSGRFSRI